MSKELFIANKYGKELYKRTITSKDDGIPPAPEDQKIVCPDKKEVVVDWRRNFERIEEISRVIEDAEIVQEEGTYRVEFDRPDIPFAIGFIFADSHIGSYTSDHELIRKVLDFTLKTPNSFIVDAGDTFDNGIWGGLQFEQVLPPYMQAFTIKDIIRELGKKFACTVIGNHPEWLFYSAGQKPEYMFASNIEGPVFPGMGLLHLEVGDKRYDIAVAHRYWGQSKKNIFNCCVNFRNHEYPNAHVFIVAHEHLRGWGVEEVDGVKRLYIRPGTAKVKDRYARMHGIARRGQSMGVAVIFGRDNFDFQAFSIERAVEQMNLYKEIFGRV